MLWMFSKKNKMRMGLEKSCRFCLSEMRSSMWTRCIPKDPGQKMRANGRMLKTISTLRCSKSIEASVLTGHMSLSRVLRVTKTTFGS